MIFWSTRRTEDWSGSVAVFGEVAAMVTSFTDIETAQPQASSREVRRNGGIDMHWVDFLGYSASIAVLATFCMSTMLPLRVIALSSNILFASYGLIAHLYPVLMLHIILFPVNLVRLAQVTKLGRRTSYHGATDIPIEMLIPFMNPRQFPAGATLFRKGDLADRLFYIKNGTMEVIELGIFCRAGDLIGEIGIFAPDRKRMASIVCRTDCEIFELTEAKVKQLFFHDPSFAFAVIQLIVRRLLENVQYYAERLPTEQPSGLLARTTSISYDDEHGQRVTQSSG